MSSRRILIYLLIIIVLLTLTRPSAAWAEAKRMWAQRNWTLGVIATVLIIYLAYGLYQIWQAGLWWR
jgi:hypothetical protein